MKISAFLSLLGMSLVSLGAQAAPSLDLSPFYGKKLITNWQDHGDASGIEFQSLVLNADGTFSGIDEYLAGFRPDLGHAVKNGTYEVSSDASGQAQITFHYDSNCRVYTNAAHGLGACEDITMPASVTADGQLQLDDPGTEFDGINPPFYFPAK